VQVHNKHCEQSSVHLINTAKQKIPKRKMCYYVEFNRMISLTVNKKFNQI